MKRASLLALGRMSLQSLSSAGKLSGPTEVVFLAAVDGTEQRYIEMLPADFDARKQHDVLIALHGHGADRQQYVVESRGECKAARDAAARYEMIFISPDYRATTSWMGPKAEADLIQIIGDLRRKYEIGKVFLTGGSMGGSSVLTFAALHPDLVAGVASQNGTANHVEYQNFQDAIAASFGGTKTERADEYRKRSAEFWPERFTMPVAICAGGKDESVPPQSVLRLAKALQERSARVLLLYREEGGHNTNYEDTMAGLEFVIQQALQTRSQK